MRLPGTSSEAAGVDRGGARSVGTWLGWLLLNQAPWVLFAATLAVFGWMSPRFLTEANLANLLVQAASTTVVATGMTLVLLTGGVDLSVGAIVFLAGAVAGKLALAGAPFGVCAATMLMVGAGAGALNAILVAGLRIPAFIATLGTLYVGRGFSQWLTETRAMNLPGSFLEFGAVRWLGIPGPVIWLAVCVGVVHLVLRRTPFGRHVYAVGHDAGAARKAGLPVGWILMGVYVMCGACAGLGGLLSLGQLGTVSPTFGLGKEFTAIAAAVLGGTSLFGGRGGVWPGTVLGALLMQSVENGLNLIDADPYLYPVAVSGIIFVAVLLDSVRSRWLARRSRRRIRREA